MKEVVLQDRQFSAWNPWTHGKVKGKFSQEEIWEELWKTLDQATREKLYPQALEVARQVGSNQPLLIGAPAWQAPFGPKVCWYYSPISMIPAGSAPPWAARAHRTFTPSGIDPGRFVFCEGVR